MLSCLSVSFSLSYFQFNSFWLLISITCDIVTIGDTKYKLWLSKLSGLDQYSKIKLREKFNQGLKSVAPPKKACPNFIVYWLNKNWQNFFLVQRQIKKPSNIEYNYFRPYIKIKIMAAKEVKRQKTAKKLPRLPPHTLDNPSDLQLTLRQEMELYETILLRLKIRGFFPGQNQIKN